MYAWGTVMGETRIKLKCSEYCETLLATPDMQKAMDHSDQSSKKRDKLRWTDRIILGNITQELNTGCILYKIGFKKSLLDSIHGQDGRRLEVLIDSALAPSLSLGSSVTVR